MNEDNNSETPNPNEIRPLQTNDESLPKTNSLDADSSMDRSFQDLDTINSPTPENLDYNKPTSNVNFITQLLGKPGALFKLFGCLVYLTGFIVSYGEYYLIISFIVGTTLIRIGDMRYSTFSRLNSRKVNVKDVIKSVCIIILTVLIFIVFAILASFVVHIIPGLTERSGGFFNTPNFYGNAVINISAIGAALLFYRANTR